MLLYVGFFFTLITGFPILGETAKGVMIRERGTSWGLRAGPFSLLSQPLWHVFFLNYAGWREEGGRVMVKWVWVGMLVRVISFNFPRNELSLFSVQNPEGGERREAAKSQVRREVKSPLPRPWPWTPPTASGFHRLSPWGTPPVKDPAKLWAVGTDGWGAWGIGTGLGSSLL